MAQKKKDSLNEKKIDEVVIVGFGQKKTVNELTGAVGNIKADAIENVPVASIDKMLQGRVAGVQTGNVLVNWWICYCKSKRDCFS
jgi:outer membrane receptor for Fe3+-dicitrate